MDYINALGNLMTYSVRKRDAISNNIANESTPDYKAEVVKWHEALGRTGEEMELTNDGHISLENPNQPYSVETDNQTKVNSNGNNVDLNNEIVGMMKNNQLYSMTIQAFNNYYEAMGAARGK